MGGALKTESGAWGGYKGGGFPSPGKVHARPLGPCPTPRAGAVLIQTGRGGVGGPSPILHSGERGTRCILVMVRFAVNLVVVSLSPIFTQLKN